MSKGLQFGQVAVDCEHAERLAGFWSAFIGRPVDEGANEHFARIGASDDGRQPAMIFLKVPEQQTIKNRWHLDFFADEPAAQVERAVELGATKLADNDEYGTQWTTLADPEGNLFDVGLAH